MNRASSGPDVVIDAGEAYTPAERIERARIVVQDGKVARVGSIETVHVPDGGSHVDAREWILAPGFIDTHVHGSAGADTMEARWESLDRISRNLARHGTTAFYPTTVSAPPDVLRDTVRKLGMLMREEYGGARPIGIHLEGPFLSLLRRGAHPASAIRTPDVKLFEEWFSAAAGALRLLALAPELDGAGSVIEAAQARQVVVAMGHSDASMEAALDAAGRGVCYAVHTFNAMREFRPRDPGIAGAVLADDRVWAEIIADGAHVAPAAVRIFARAKPEERVILVTDATSATDMPDGTYRLGSQAVTVSGGTCRDAEGRLAGSTLTQDAALRNFMGWTGRGLESALRALTSNPAAAARIPRKGVLAPGADADLVLLDRAHRVVRTYVGGKCVFDRLA